MDFTGSTLVETILWVIWDTVILQMLYYVEGFMFSNTFEVIHVATSSIFVDYANLPHSNLA